ncbi:MAG: tetratricopeptide repeat protein [bacterium]|nr:tetratricopeptide repeat protein [bacterium]
MQERNKRATKAELEEDEFLEWVLRSIEYLKTHAQLIVGGVVGIVAVIAIVSFMQTQRGEASERAAALLFEATIADRSGQVDQVIRIGQQLVDTYAGTSAAAQGMVLLGNRYFTLGRYADAERLYHQYLDAHGDLDALTYAAVTGLAACREAKGDLEGAARDYVAYADNHPVSPPSALALMQAARCYAQLGDVVRRRETLERVTQQHSATPVAQRAREQLGMMM